MALDVQVTSEELRLLLESGYLSTERREYVKAKEIFEGVQALGRGADVAEVGLANLYLMQGNYEPWALGTPVSEPDPPVHGDILQVSFRRSGSQNLFDVYLNGEFQGTLTDSQGILDPEIWYAGVAFENDGRDFGAGFHLRERLLQLAHQRNVDDIQRRIAQLQASDSPRYYRLKPCRHIDDHRLFLVPIPSIS